MAINLLPPKEKRIFEIEAMYRRVSILMILALLGFFFFILILVGVNFYATSQANDSRVALTLKETELRKANLQGFKETMEQTNQYIAQVRNFWQRQVFVAPLLERMTLLKPKSIYFSTFSFQKTSPKNQIALSGFAQTRGALYYFKQNLDKELSFGDVFFAPVSWVKPNDIDFSLAFLYSQQSIKQSQ